MYRNNKVIRLLNFMGLLLLFQMFSCAQTKSVVKNVYPFFIERLPGMIRVDINNKPVTVKRDTTLIVYIETTSKLIYWDSAWLNGKKYAIATQLIVATPFNAGAAKKDDRNYILNAKEGNYLWQLYLAVHLQNTITPVPIGENEILLKGKIKKKTIFQKTGSPVELIATPSV